jgi:hypothetical protein
MPKHPEKNAFPVFDSLKTELSLCHTYAPTSFTVKQLLASATVISTIRVVAFVTELFILGRARPFVTKMS